MPKYKYQRNQKIFLNICWKNHPIVFSKYVKFEPKYFILRAFGLKNDALNLNNGKNIKKLISIMAHDSVILLIETPNNVDKINKKKKTLFLYQAIIF